jgi:hypothetical protein
MVALVVAPDAVPEHDAPEASAASRTLIADDRMRHELPELPSAFTDDAATRPHVRLSPTHARPCQRAMRPRRPAHRRQCLGVEKVLTTSGTKQVETRWVGSTIAAALLALLGVISLLVLGACQVDSAADATPTVFTVPATDTRAAFLTGAWFGDVDATEGP